MIDSLLTIETPEGVQIELRLAGLVPRALAFAIDFALRAILLFALSFLLLKLGKIGQGLLLISWFLLEWFYPVFFEVYNRGQTLGKYWLGIMVVEQSGLPVGWRASLTRNILRAADFLPFAYASGIVALLHTQQFQRLGDLAANTVVVWKKTAYADKALINVAPLEPSEKLHLQEQRLLVNLAQRLDDLPETRQQELADLAQPLTHATGESSKQRLLAIANYLAGQR